MKIKAGILGATGMVGQRFVQLLENHPWFEITALAASERSAGKTYGEVMDGRWKISADVPAYARAMPVQECRPNLDCKIVFSALDADVAGPIEAEFARAGYAVSSNAKNYRMEADVPLLIPEVNPDHLKLIPVQKKNRGSRGFIVTNPNCTTIHMVLVLKPLMQFGLSQVMVTSMQALSGAGYPGVPSLDILDNVLPYIGGEEEKVQSETLKLLGSFNGHSIANARMTVSASCNRVNVNDAHTEAVSVKLDGKPPLQEVIAAMENFNPLKELNLPMAPDHPIIVRRENNRPQPKIDRTVEKGMASVVGRVRECPIMSYKFTLVGHNTIRGAAGAAILNAELMNTQGYLDGR